MSDDEANYRPKVERTLDAERDPVETLPRFIVENGLATSSELESLRREVDAEIEAATQQALAAPTPEPAEVLDFIYSAHVDPTSAAFDTTPEFSGEDQTLVDLVNACMRDEMARDPRIVVFGEDVADASRPEALSECKGKGGVFKVTHGLQKRFGENRVFNSPLAEANIVGRALGMAMRGLKPVVEIQFFDYIWPAYMQLRNELALMRWRSNNAFSAPVVVQRSPLPKQRRQGCGSRCCSVTRKLRCLRLLAAPRQRRVSRWVCRPCPPIWCASDRAFVVPSSRCSRRPMPPASRGPTPSRRSACWVLWA
jgi:2-oxoisovalerate dehydrogenase E1 component